MIISEQGVSWGVQAKRDCEARLRALVPADERILAVGTAEELGELDEDIGSGGGWTFLIVTSRRLLFARWARPDEPHHEIVFDRVGGWADGTQYNCYAVALTHPPMVRREAVPAHRFLWFAWGNAEVDRTRTTTILRFSRPDTEAARALRASLEERVVGHQALRFRELSREERTRGSHALLRAEP